MCIRDSCGSPVFYVIEILYGSGVIRENEFTFNSENVIIFIIMRANVIKRKTGKNYHV